MPTNRDDQHSGPVGAQAGSPPKATPGHPDPIDQAIAAAAQPRMVVFGGQFQATGRQFQVVLPEDCSDLEFLAVVGFVVNLRDVVEQQRVARGRILLPTGPIPRA